MFDDAIKVVQNNDIKLIKQSEKYNDTLRCFPRIPEDSEIDWNQTACFIDRLIRASSEPFNGAYTFLKGQKIIIWRARIESYNFKYLANPGQVLERNVKSQEVVVATGKDLLVIEKAQIEQDNQEFNPAKIIKSMRLRLGMNVYNEIENLKKEITRLKELFFLKN